MIEHTYIYTKYQSLLRVMLAASTILHLQAIFVPLHL